MSYAPYNPDTADLVDRCAWTLCQIIDDDAPMRWTRYRFVVECIAANKPLLLDFQVLNDLSKAKRPE